MKSLVAILLIMLIMMLSVALVSCDEDDETGESQGTQSNSSGGDSTTFESGVFGYDYNDLTPENVKPEDVVSPNYQFPDEEI